MAKLIITALEQAVLKNIQNYGVGQVIPQNFLSTGPSKIKSNQVGAVVNNMIGKGLLERTKDLFGNTVSLTRSGKIQTTKLMRSSTIAQIAA